MAKKVMKKVSKERHWGITLLGVLGYICSVVILLAGLAMLTFSAYLGKLLASIPAATGIETIITTLGAIGFITLGIIFIALAILEYFIARGLLKGQNWARIIMIIFSALAAISALISLDIINLIVEAIIIWYLGFYKPAVNYFK